MLDTYQILMRHRHSKLEVEHLLLALLEQPGGFAEDTLEQLGVAKNNVIALVEEKLAEIPPDLPEPSRYGVNVSLVITPRVQKVLAQANKNRAGQPDDLVTSRDLLLAIVADPSDPAALLLKSSGLTGETLGNLAPEKPETPTPVNVVQTGTPVEDTPLTHFNEEGRARMVDVSEKAVTGRRAVARGEIRMLPETLALIREGRAKKGDVLAVAQVAGIMAAKKTSEIIPMCHPLMLTGIDLRFEYASDRSAVLIEAEVKTSGQTGVEMEALTAVSAAALTIYDMVKATDKGMRIENIRLAHKSGGKSGDYEAE
jgi:cyclic pyranopterin phosphate synthase